MKKALKILLSLTLIAALMLTMVACGNRDDGDDKDKGPSGKYYLKSAKYEDKKVDIEDMFGDNAKKIYIEFKSSGKGKLVSPDEDPVEFEWEDDTLTVDGEEAKIKVKGKTVSVVDEVSELVFEKK